MWEKLVALEASITKTNSWDSVSQREYLEPLFHEIYKQIKEENITDIPTLLKLSQLENLLTTRILPVVPKVEPSLEKKMAEQIVYYARKKAMDFYHCNVQTDSLRSRSKDFSEIVLEISKNLGVASTIIDLGAIFHFPYPHYVVLAYLEDFYLFDITYQQFFLLGYNFPNRYYEHPSYIRKPEIGFYMQDSRKEAAISMIENGYLPAHSPFFLAYLDGCSLFGEQEKKSTAKEYLEILLKPILGSSDKSDRILLSKMEKDTE